MLNLYIAMGDEKNAQEAGQLVRHFAESQGRSDLNIITCQTLAQLQQYPSTHIVLLDEHLPDCRGMKAPRMLRESCPTAQLIYFADTDDHAAEAYRLRILQYLTRPAEEGTLQAALENAIILAGKRAEDRFVLNTPEGIRRLEIPHILYLRSDKHVVHAYLRSGQQVISRNLRISFSELVQPLLATGQFVHTHQSYVVNINYVDRLSADGLTLFNDVVIPISYSKHAQVKALWRNWGVHNQRA